MTDYFIDFETKSQLDIKEVGAHRYARHISTRPILMSWAADKGPVRLWREGDALPFSPAPGDRLISHNIEFDANIWHRFFRVKVPIEQLYDTSALSVHCGLPRDLEMAAKAIGSKYLKQKNGKALIRKFCVIDHENNVKGGTEQDWQEFEEYCVADTAVCRELFYRLPPMLPPERTIWEEHFRINLRGVPVNMRRVRKLHAICQEAERQIRQTEFGKIIFSPVALVRHFRDCGYTLPNAQADTLDDVLGDPNLPPDLREIIDLRRRAAKASVKKLARIIDYDAGDGKLRGLHLYFGGHTGRFSGVGPQFQNLIRECAKDIPAEMAKLDALPDNPAEAIELLGGPADSIKWASTIIRPLIQAPSDDQDLGVADFKAIEARELCWLVDAKGMMDVFRKGGDPYVEMGAKVFHKKVEDIDHEERRIGKNLFLGAGYGLGPVAYVSYSAKAGSIVTPEEGKAHIYGYREAVPEVPAGWKALDRAVETVMAYPLGHGVSLFGGKLIIWVGGNNKSKVLCCRLPSKRIFRWHFPAYATLPGRTPGELDTVFTYASYRGDPKKSVKAAIIRRCEQQKLDPAPFLNGLPSCPEGWIRLSLWGGTLIENIVQAIARDLLCWAMVRMARAGMPVVFHVHDELVNLVPKGTAFKVIAEPMSMVPSWATGSIIGVSGFVEHNYRKD